MQMHISLFEVEQNYPTPPWLDPETHHHIIEPLQRPIYHQQYPLVNN